MHSRKYCGYFELKCEICKEQFCEMWISLNGHGWTKNCKQSGKDIVVSVKCSTERSEQVTIQKAELLHVRNRIKISAEQIWMAFGVVILKQWFWRESWTLHETRILLLSVFCLTTTCSSAREWNKTWFPLWTALLFQTHFSVAYIYWNASDAMHSLVSNYHVFMSTSARKLKHMLNEKKHIYFYLQ